MIAAQQYDHWNRPEHLPPVGCPLVIQVPTLGVLRCERTSHVADRSQELTYQIKPGWTLTGRFMWSYP